MALKRYGIVFEEARYRRYKAEAANVGVPVGEWMTNIIDRLMLGKASYKEAAMDDIAKKAIEKDDIKVQPSGKLSKGLGDLPGTTNEAGDLARSFRPVPKPGAKKK